MVSKGIETVGMDRVGCSSWQVGNGFRGGAGRRLPAPPHGKARGDRLHASQPGRFAGQGGEYVLGSFLGQFPRSAASSFLEENLRSNSPSGVSAKEFRAAGDAVGVIMVPETAARRTIQTEKLFF
jgi:hypothetical protein